MAENHFTLVSTSTSPWKVWQHHQRRRTRTNHWFPNTTWQHTQSRLHKHSIQSQPYGNSAPHIWPQHPLVEMGIRLIRRTQKPRKIHLNKRADWDDMETEMKDLNTKFQAEMNEHTPDKLWSKKRTPHWSWWTSTSRPKSVRSATDSITWPGKSTDSSTKRTVLPNSARKHSETLPAHLPPSQNWTRRSGTSSTTSRRRWDRLTGSISIPSSPRPPMTPLTQAHSVPCTTFGST